MNTFDWFLERLEVAKWNDERPGNRDCLTNCPVHGGSDSLHLTEKNGKALIKCFNPACGAGYGEVVAAIESEPEPEEKPITVHRSRGRRARPGGEGNEASAELSAGTGGSTPPRLHHSPLDWLAARSGLTRAELDALALPLAEDQDKVVFDFPEVASRKLRPAVEGKKKSFYWEGSSVPSLWPIPSTPKAEVAVVEGEGDAICLRHSGIDAYSVTGGSGTHVPDAVWEALLLAGVTNVRLVFDHDDAGKKGRDSAAEGARRAGLSVRESRVVGVQPLLGETDARGVALRAGYPLALEDDVTEEGAVPLTTVKPATDLTLLLSWLHPNEHTILFGDGGTGKGVIVAYWITELVAGLGKTVMVVDYEQHARHEWRPRVGRFACGRYHKTVWHDDPACSEANAIMDRVYYVQPIKPIWELAGWLRAEADRVGADYLVVDSVTYACGGLEPEKSTTAVKYTQAINAIGLPVLSIGHVTKAEADPRHPFGSIYWHNGARVTIGVSRRGEAPDSDRIVRHRKANQGQHQKDTAIDWSWLPVDLPPKLDFGMAWGSAQEAFDALLAESGAVPSAAEVENAFGQEVSPGNYRKMLSRLKGGGASVPVTINGGRGLRRSAPDVGSESDGD